MYNTQSEITYTNNEEYRNCLRQLFEMNAQSLDETLDKTSDPETYDEQDYDNTSASTMLDYIYAITKADSLFQELYGYGAGTMFSTDPEIGLTVLFSYDYFILFHQCLQQFIDNPILWNSTNCAFVALRLKITR